MRSAPAATARQLPRALVALTMLTTATAAQGPDAFGRVLFEVGNDHPFFTPADIAVDETGQLRAEYFHPHALLWLNEARNQAAAGGSDCFGLDIEAHAVTALDRSTLADAVRTSDLVAVATVAARHPGFGRMEPGYLLEVDLRFGLVKGSTNAERHYVFWPGGSFDVSGLNVCHTSSGFPETPEIGDILALLIRRVERGSEILPLWSSGDILLVRRPSGQVTGAAPLSSDQKRAIAEAPAKRRKARLKKLLAEVL